jgi:hypothetical protein
VPAAPSTLACPLQTPSRRRHDTTTALL